MEKEKINLEFLKKSKKKKKVGDIFIFKPKGHNYYFGRIIDVNADCGFGPISNLIYVYNSTSKDKNKIPKLDKDNLLLPPFFINNLPWVRGYFETVKNCPLKEDDVFEKHCFWNPISKNYVDEKNKEIKEKLPWEFGFFEVVDKNKPMRIYKGYAPVGFSALSGYGSFHVKISKKLGIPLVED